MSNNKNRSSEEDETTPECAALDPTLNNKIPLLTPDPVELVTRVWDMTLEELYCGKELNWPSETQSICTRCAGKGKLITMSYRRDSECYACQGSGKKISVRTIKVHLQPGTEDGFEKLVKGVGWPPKDVLLKVHEKPHEYFRRQGHDLYVCLQLSFVEALCGFQKFIRTLDGRELCIAPCQGCVISPDSIKCVDYEGFPHKDNPHQRGKLFIRFLVDIPKLDPEVAQKLACILQGDKSPDYHEEPIENEIILQDA